MVAVSQPRFRPDIFMKVAESLLAVTVAALAVFVAVQGRVLPVDDTFRASAAATLSTRNAPTIIRSENGIMSTERVRRAALRSAPGEERLVTSEYVEDIPRAPALPANEMRRRLAMGESGTYMGSLLASRDSTLTRWPDRLTAPLRIWIADGGQHEGWDPAFPNAVREAFEYWRETGIPVRFTYVRDSARADVRVSFTPSFPQGISGRTVWSRDTDWWLVSGSIELALSHPAGGFVDLGQLRAITLHEIGHLLGLDHVDDPTHIMSPRVRARDLSEQDRATVRLLYSVPAGSAR